MKVFFVRPAVLIGIKAHRRKAATGNVVTQEKTPHFAHLLVFCNGSVTMRDKTQYTDVRSKTREEEGGTGHRFNVSGHHNGRD